MIPIYCLVREYTNDYLDKKVISFSENNQLCFDWVKINELYYEFIQIWNSLFKIDIFKFRSLVKNEIVLPRILNSNFDKIFYNIEEYLEYIKYNKNPFFLYSIDNDDYLINDFSEIILEYLEKNLDLVFWNHCDYLNDKREIKFYNNFDLKNKDWFIQTNNFVFKNIQTPLVQHWEIQHKFFPNMLLENNYNVKYIPQILSLKNSNLSAYTTCINLHDNEINGPKLLIINKTQLLKKYQNCLSFPKNFNLIPNVFQEDIRKMLEIYKVLL